MKHHLASLMTSLAVVLSVHATHSSNLDAKNVDRSATTANEETHSNPASIRACPPKALPHPGSQGNPADLFLRKAIRIEMMDSPVSPYT